MRQAVGFPGGSIGCQREDSALSDEVRRGVVLVQLREDWSERLARVQLLCGRGILGVHVHHEMGVCGKKRHLRFRITTIGAVCVGLDELPDSEAIRGVTGRDSSVIAHELVSYSIRSATQERSLENSPWF